MIKGCKKNVVYVKNTGSEMFDEAYFIVSEKGGEKRATESDMVREAGRLISESPSAGYFPSTKGDKKKEKLSIIAIGKAA